MRIFISHSSGQDTLLVETIAARLKAEGYEPLLDRNDIKTGAEWRQNINAWLAECHAGLVLFSRRAIDESAWVLKEATVLSWRRSIDQNFKLIPVRLKDVKSEDLTAGRYSPLALGEIQALKNDDVEEVLDAIRTAVGPPQAFATPLQRVEDAIADLIEKVGSRSLETACRDHFGVTSWAQETDRRQRFAQLLSRKILQDGENCLENAVKVLASLRLVLNQSTANHIIDLVAPFWVEPDAASSLKLAAQRKMQFRDVAMNGKLAFEFTAPMYVRRASPMVRAELVAVDEGYADAFVEHVSTCLRQHAAQIQRHKRTPVELDQYINTRLKPPFVLLPILPSAEELDELRGRYPDATFISATGDLLPDPASVPPGMSCLPLLDLNIEDFAFTAYQDALQFVGTLNQ